MREELIQRADAFPGPAETVYFGGGTPSLLPVAEIEGLLELVRDRTGIEKEAEITMECNPEDIAEDKLQGWIRAGINRLSIGLQSFDESNLHFLNRGHTPARAAQSVLMARKVGFRNISADLIFGIPGSDLSRLEEDVGKLMRLKPEHISAYQLTIEEKTALAYRLKKKHFSMVEEEEIRKAFLWLHQRLTGAGYFHYEISNYALPGMESRHNQSYWNGKTYLGIGPSAHSFDGKSRRWNVAGNMKYVNGFTTGDYYDWEQVGATETYNELIMTGLRTSRGILFGQLREVAGKKQLRKVKEYMKMQERLGLAVIDEKGAKLTPEGWLVSDLLAAALFRVG